MMRRWNVIFCVLTRLVLFLTIRRDLHLVLFTLGYVSCLFRSANSTHTAIRQNLSDAQPFNIRTAGENEELLYGGNTDSQVKVSLRR